jgi:hypothetical protein
LCHLVQRVQQPGQRAGLLDQAGACPGALELAAERTHSREDNHRRLRLNAADDVATGSVAELKVDNRGIRLTGCEQVEGAVDAVGRNHVEVALPQEVFQRFPEVVVVFDDQDQRPCGVHVRCIGRFDGRP